MIGLKKKPPESAPPPEPAPRNKAKDAASMGALAAAAGKLEHALRGSLIQAQESVQAAFIERALPAGVTVQDLCNMINTAANAAVSGGRHEAGLLEEVRMGRLSRANMEARRYGE